jgi:hypothetical protein
MLTLIASLETIFLSTFVMLARSIGSPPSCTGGSSMSPPDSAVPAILDRKPGPVHPRETRRSGTSAHAATWVIEMLAVRPGHCGDHDDHAGGIDLLARS